LRLSAGGRCKIPCKIYKKVFWFFFSKKNFLLLSFLKEFLMNRKRTLPISGGHNLRDMGGYETKDGRRLKWRTLFRSGVMAGLDQADADAFRELGIVAICDLRTPVERRRRPTEWHEGTEIYYHARDYDLSAGNLEAMLARENVPPDAIEEIILQVYRELPFEQAEGYRELFRLLAAGRVPLLFNCTAGKDRTGVAAALVLLALDVPRETIEDDYALTEAVIHELEVILLGDPRYTRLARIPRAHYLPLLQANPAYLGVAFDAIERRYGSVGAYFETVLGVGAAEIAAMKAVLLE